jgi:hypothetical protein
MPLATCVLRVIRIPAGAGECQCAQSTSGPRQRILAVPDALGYTCGIPVHGIICRTRSPRLAERRKVWVSYHA